MRILAVTKTHPVEAALYAHRAGLAGAGENRVQEALEKIAACPDPAVRWELIGHLQSNKAAKAAAAFARIQSVDRAELAQKLDRAAATAGRVLPVLLQINAGDDPAKFGATCADAPAAAGSGVKMPRAQNRRPDDRRAARPGKSRRGPALLRPLARNPRRPRETIRHAAGGTLHGHDRRPRSRRPEGSTLVRVGTALFGKRG